MLLIKIYLMGIVILIAAVLLNLLANGFGLATWYSFLNQVAQQSFYQAVRNLKVIDMLFLILLYPLLLGLAAYLTLSLTSPFLR